MGEAYEYGNKSDGYALRLDTVEVTGASEVPGDVKMVEGDEGEALKKEEGKDAVKEETKDAVKPEELDNPVLCCINVMGRVRKIFSIFCTSFWLMVFFLPVLSSSKDSSRTFLTPKTLSNLILFQSFSTSLL